MEEAIPEYNDLFNCLSTRTGSSADECSNEAARYKETLKNSPKRFAIVSDLIYSGDAEKLKEMQDGRKEFLIVNNLPLDAFESNKPLSSYKNK